MKVLHLLATGEIGGIETLIKNYDEKSVHENLYVFVWSGGTIADALLERGRKVEIFGKSNVQLFGVLKEVLRLCREEQIQAVMVHHESPLLKLILVLLKLLRPKLPAAAYAHADAMVLCNENKPKGFGVRKLIQRIGFGMADGVIAISGSVAESLKTVLKLPEKKIQIIYNGIPLREFQRARQPVKTEKDAFIVTYVGRLSVEKGVENILQMFSALKPEILQRIKLRIVGDGPEREKLEQLAEEKKLSGRVQFLGSRTDVGDLLQESDFFVHFPNCKEGFGIAVIEAMAAENICICLSKGALPEIITHGRDGYLLEELSAEQLEALLEDLIKRFEEPELQAVRKKAALRAGEFSLESFAGQLDQYIEVL